MSKYFVRTIVEGNTTDGKHRDKKAKAIKDALAQLSPNRNATVLVYRWGEPRKGNRGAVESYESPGGRNYDMVLTDILVRQRIA